MIIVVFDMSCVHYIHPIGAFLYTTTNGSAILQEQQSRSNRFGLLPSHPCSEVLESSIFAYDGMHNVYCMYALFL